MRTGKFFRRFVLLRHIMCVAFDPCSEGKVWSGEKCASFDELGLNSDGRSCKQEGYSWGNSHCEKTCDDDLCKDKAHSTGLCLQVINDSVSQRIKCQCEENYFIYQYSYYSEFECVNPCEPNPCTGEGYTGNCTAANAREFRCDCKKGYYFDSPNCFSVTKNDCYTDYYDAVCVNNMAGIIWSSTSGGTLKWDEAREYCENLDEAGYTDWRLPKVEELWTFAKSCNNIPKESCEAGESSGCLSEECIAQCRCKVYLENNTVDYLWSSSFKQDDPEKVIIFYKYYAILEFFNIKTDGAKVKCVRNLHN